MYKKVMNDQISVFMFNVTWYTLYIIHVQHLYRVKLRVSHHLISKLKCIKNMEYMKH